MKYDDISTNLLVDAPAWVQDALEQGIEKRALAKAMEDEAADVKKGANELLEAALEFMGVSKVESDTGLVLRKDMTRTTIDPEVMSAYLVEHGVSAQVVKNARDKATKVSKYKTLEFRLPQKNGVKVQGRR